MVQSKLKPAFLLSAIIAVLALAASAGGLLIPDLYRDNAFVETAWFGNDLFTLFIAVPGLLAALVLSMRSSQRAQLVWLGMLGYMLYNYAFYLFGAAFNRFFLLYVGLFALSLYALVLALPNVEVQAISRGFRARTPVKWISAFLLLVAVFFGLVETAQSLSFVASGQLPQIVVDSAHPTSVVFALDLTLVVPGLALAAFLLWKRHPWGYVLGMMLSIKGVTYMLVLIISSAILFIRTGAGDALTPVYMLVCAGCLISVGFLLANLQPVEERMDSRSTANRLSAPGTR